MRCTGKLVGSQHPIGYVFMQLPGSLARDEGACGVRIDHDLDHHGRMKRLVARTTLGGPGVKGRQVQAVYGVVNKVRQMPLGQPVLQGAGQ